LHNFTLVNMDTDSISISKADKTYISKEERDQLLEEINSILPQMIRMDDDGFFDTVIVLKAKNYILYDGNKIKIKGSALKASGKGDAEKGLIKEFIDTIIHVHDEAERYHKLLSIYARYVQEAIFIDTQEEMSRWTARKTISEKIMTSERENEAKVRRAIEGTDYVEGDRVRVFFMPDDSLCLIENFNGEYDRRKLLDKIYKTVLIFNTILPVKEMFPNYSLKRNRVNLSTIYGIEL
jgi:DNA polymerase elongation subunit (family B)